MADSSSIFHQAINNSIQTLESLVDLDAQVAKAADLIEQCLRAGNKLLVCGNGGSAADAAHFATELVVRFGKDRSVWRTMADFSPPRPTITVSMKSLPARSRHLVFQAICSFA
jgi:phosphoheptose isomerase